MPSEAKSRPASWARAAIQQRVARAFERDGTPPPDLEAAGLAADLAEAAAEFVESVQIVNGRIELRFGRSADAAIMGSVLSLTPFETAEQDVVWICGNRRTERRATTPRFRRRIAPGDAGVDHDRRPLPAVDLPLTPSGRPPKNVACVTFGSRYG